MIEIFVRSLKSRCQVEAMQLTTLERLLVISLIIAWRMLFLVMTGRECPDLPCDVAFAPGGMAGSQDRFQMQASSENSTVPQRNDTHRRPRAVF